MQLAIDKASEKHCDSKLVKAVSSISDSHGHGRTYKRTHNRHVVETNLASRRLGRCKEMSPWSMADAIVDANIHEKESSGPKCNGYDRKIGASTVPIVRGVSKDDHG